MEYQINYTNGRDICATEYLTARSVMEAWSKGSARAQGRERVHSVYPMTSVQTTTMETRKAQLLQDAYRERAKIRVHLAANPDNVVIQFVGNLVLRAYNHVIAKKEAT
jgi:hypothetical protein